MLMDRHPINKRASALVHTPLWTALVGVGSHTYIIATESVWQAIVQQAAEWQILLVFDLTKLLNSAATPAVCPSVAQACTCMQCKTGWASIQTGAVILHF